MEILAKIFLTGMAIAFWGFIWWGLIDPESLQEKGSDNEKIVILCGFLLPLPVGLLIMSISGLLIVWFK